MNIRKYQTSDCAEIAKLFYDTVHTINAEDYTSAQLNVWATGCVNLESWDKSFLENITYVAVVDSLIVGFGDISHQGYLDRLYVHKDYQRKCIATAIVEALESDLKDIASFTTHASITSVPFLEKRGYKVVCQNIVVRDGVEIVNFEMKKYPSNSLG